MTEQVTGLQSNVQVQEKNQFSDQSVKSISSTQKSIIPSSIQSAHSGTCQSVQMDAASSAYSGAFQSVNTDAD